VVLVGGGLVAFTLYRRSTANSLLAATTPALSVPATPAAIVAVPSQAERATPTVEPEVVVPPVTAPSEVPATVPVATNEAASKTTNDQILFGEQVDSDKDGVSDSDEITLYRTDPRNDDTDGDNLSDGEEILVWRTEALKPDSDGDGLTDGDEVKLWSTNPLNPDSDGDSHVDGQEVFNGYNPNGPGKLTRYPNGMSTSTYNAKYGKK
jgi:hypothetical protein